MSIENTPSWDQDPQASAGAGLLRVLRQHKLLIGVVVLVAVAAGGLYLMLTPPTYTSTARLYVEQRSPRVIADDNGVMTQSKNYLYTQAELFRSVPILEGAIQQGQLDQLAMLADVGDPIARLKGRVQARVGERDDIICVSCEAQNPQEAAKVANALVDSYMHYQASQKRSSAGEVLRILRQEKQQQDKDLQQRLAALVQFRQEHKTLSFETNEGNVVLQQLASLTTALTTAQVDTIYARAQFEAQRATEPTSVAPAALDDQMAPLQSFHHQEQLRLRGAINDLRVKLAAQTRRQTANSPAIQDLAAQIAELERALEQSSRSLWDKTAQVARQRLESALAREQALQQTVDHQQEMAQDLGIKATQYAILQADLDRTERLSDLLEGRIREIDLSGDTGGLNVTLLETAMPAIVPTRPQRATTMAIAAVLGLLLGGALALQRGWKSPTLHDGVDIAAAMGEPVMGSLPHIGGAVRDRAQAVLHKPASDVAEACRSLRTALHFGPARTGCKSLLITSPASGDGKTTLASNLAIVTAQSGRRTLLIDANLRHPGLHRAFNIANGPGLAEVIGRGMSAQQRIQPTDVLNLDLLTAGMPQASPPDLLNNPRLKDVLTELSARYDWVILDAPAAASLADAHLLAAAADATLIVLRSDRTSYQAAQQARQRLAGTGANVIGYVANDIPAGSPWSVAQPGPVQRSVSRQSQLTPGGSSRYAG